jgi:hypothetical protein
MRRRNESDEAPVVELKHNQMHLRVRPCASIEIMKKYRWDIPPQPFEGSSFVSEITEAAR